MRQPQYRHGDDRGEVVKKLALDRI